MLEVVAERRNGCPLECRFHEQRGVCIGNSCTDPSLWCHLNAESKALYFIFLFHQTRDDPARLADPCHKQAYIRVWVIGSSLCRKKNHPRS